MNAQPHMYIPQPLLLTLVFNQIINYLSHSLSILLIINFNQIVEDCAHKDQHNSKIQGDYIPQLTDTDPKLPKLKLFLQKTKNQGLKPLIT